MIDYFSDLAQLPIQSNGNRGFPAFTSDGKTDSPAWYICLRNVSLLQLDRGIQDNVGGAWLSAVIMLVIGYIVLNFSSNVWLVLPEAFTVLTTQVRS